MTTSTSKKAYTTVHVLNGLTFTKKFLQQVLDIDPTAHKFETMPVPAMGMVVYVTNKQGESLGHVYKEFNQGIRRAVYLQKNASN